MSGLMILLVLLSPPQDPKKAAESPAEPARKVADPIMVQPRITIQRPAQVDVPAKQAAIVMRGVQPVKRITLELKEVEKAPDDEGPQPVGLGRPINLNELALSKDNFERWVFADDLGMEARRDRLDKMLSDKLFSVDRGRPLEPEQLRKLRLAGNGDIKRFLDRVDASRVEFEAVRQDYRAGRLALARYEPLSADYRDGPFGPDSVFEKTLRKIRGDEKAATGKE